MKKALEEAPECARCGERSSEDTLTLYDCGGYYLCGDGFELNERINNEKST